ncbi:MAG TPA: cytochrome c3 family protein [Pyrinomonadaceae bacterium]|nr:cytochrome c3 family protein [Pyrinomonadaceae bacterium]
MLCVGVLSVAALTERSVRGPQRRKPSATSKPRVDYSRFSHVTQQHRQACNTCHTFPSKNWKEVRTSDEAFPDITEYPEHQACLGCHREQFFARERPVPRICYNCHFNATPVETSRYPFPSLGEKFLSSAKAMDFVSDFNVLFPHDKHELDPKSCDDCHQVYQPQGKSDNEFFTKPPKNLGDGFWLKKGTFETRPVTHAACFNCHNQEGELAPLPQNCDACHKNPVTRELPADFDEKLAKTIGVHDWWTLTAWRDRNSSGTFRHEIHPDVSCTNCHNVAVMNTPHVKTLSVPVKSCGGAEGCHVTSTSDEGGIFNYELDQRKLNASFVCSKCHIVFGSKPVPASHVEAIPKATK